MPTDTYHYGDTIEGEFSEYVGSIFVRRSWHRNIKIARPDGSVIDALVPEREPLPEPGSRIRAKVDQAVNPDRRLRSLTGIDFGAMPCLYWVESPPGANSPFFSDEDAAAAAAFWREKGYREIEHREDGVWVKTARKSHVHVEPQRITFHGKAARDQKAIITALEHVKEHWGTSCAVSGSNAFKQQVWTQATLMGVRIRNYEPPPHIKKRVDRMVADREAKRADPHRRESPARRQPQCGTGLGSGS